MDTTQNIELPEFAPSFTRLASTLQTDRGHLREIRDADSRFPQQSPEGWPVVKVGLLLELRRIEKMREDVFYFEKRDEARATMEAVEAGALALDGWPAPMRKRFMAMLAVNAAAGRGAATRDEIIHDLRSTVSSDTHQQQRR